jgi:hypothetical protein
LLRYCCLVRDEFDDQPMVACLRLLIAHCHQS